MAVKTEIMKRINDHFQHLSSMGVLDPSIKVDVIEMPKNEDEYNALEKQASGSIKGVVYFSFNSSNPIKTEGRNLFLKPYVMALVVVRNDKNLRDLLLEQVMTEMVKLNFAPVQDFYLSNTKSPKQMHGGYWTFELAKPMRLSM